jgi:hypothetical protein
MTGNTHQPTCFLSSMVESAFAIDHDGIGLPKNVKTCLIRAPVELAVESANNFTVSAGQALFQQAHHPGTSKVVPLQICVI